jgi:hypothetical protein
MIAAAFAGAVPAETAKAPHAVLVDGPGPWRNDSWIRAAAAFERLLTDAGYQVSRVSPVSLSPTTFIAVPSLERLPVSAFQTLAGHVDAGGHLLAAGGEPFRYPLFASAQGNWFTADELLASVSKGRTILDLASVPLRRGANDASAPFDRRKENGRVHVIIPALTGWDTLSAPAFDRTPFAPGETLTVVDVQGTPGQVITAEWKQADGSRWIARVPLAAEMRTHVLRPADFKFWPGGSTSTRTGESFRPAEARAFAFGPAMGFDALSGRCEYSIGALRVAAMPANYEEFQPPLWETISPWYKQYGDDVRIPFARPRGLLAVPEAEGRYSVIGPLIAPDATRYVRANGAVLFWLPRPGLSGIERTQLVQQLRDATHGCWLLSGGPRRIAVQAGDAIDFGARVLNAGKTRCTVEVSWAVQGSSGRSVVVDLAPNETRDIAAPALGPLPPPEHPVITTMRIGRTEVDRIESLVRVTAASSSNSRRIRVSGGRFTLNGKPLFLNGVNYYPRSVGGLEIKRYTGHWLAPENYDPGIADADLAVLESLGMNLVSLQYRAPEHGPCLLDFLERCRRHRIWANIFLGSANNLRPDATRDEAMLAAARLPGNDTVFAYDLSWEPHLGDQKTRRRHDGQWRAWIDEQYGNVATAERTWGIAAPRDEAGAVTNPTDQQIAIDGPHRIFVAAYRRFVDDLVSRIYGAVVRRLRLLDPDALMGVRTGYGGTAQRHNNAAMGYDLASGAAHLDFVSPEAYGMPPDYETGRRTGFVTAYARWAGNGKPVFWSEFGSSIGPRGGTAQSRAKQAQLCETMRRVAVDSDADGMAAWWLPGGWRLNEQSDYGILNPDGAPRDSAKALSGAIEIKPRGGEVADLEIDRDADARGQHGLYLRHGDRYLQARRSGRQVRLVTPATGRDTGGMDLIQVGNVPWEGAGPLKYANAELTRDGNSVLAVNTGEAAWTPASCVLRTNAGDVPLPCTVERYGTVRLGPLPSGATTARMVAQGRIPFGQKCGGGGITNSFAS